MSSTRTRPFYEYPVRMATGAIPRVGVADAAVDRGFFGHPSGLSTLFFTEMWERFSYYGMRAFLIFYMTAPKTLGGQGLLDTVTGKPLPIAGAIVGMFGASVYLLGLPGGWIADRFLGQRKAVAFGGAG